MSLFPRRSVPALILAAFFVSLATEPAAAARASSEAAAAGASSQSVPVGESVEPAQERTHDKTSAKKGTGKTTRPRESGKASAKRPSRAAGAGDSGKTASKRPKSATEASRSGKSAGKQRGPHATPQRQEAKTSRVKRGEGSFRAATKREAEPPVLVGPSRVTFVGGRTLEAIAVIREPARVTLVLEDGSRLEFEPVLVDSVVALADLEPPAETAQEEQVEQAKDDRAGDKRKAGGTVLAGYPAPPIRYRGYPQGTPPTVSLGPSVWRPTESFTTPAQWGRPIAPATSFKNELSGWGKPTTSLQPFYWNPRPTQWAPSIFPEIWRPSDGFAESP